MAVAVAFGAAFSVGRNSGVIGLSVSVAVGLGVGIGCFCGMRVVGKWVIRRLQLEEPKLTPLRLILAWLLFFAAFIVPGFLGFWLTKLVIHLCL